MTRFAWLAAFCFALPALGHDLVTAESAQAYLARQARLHEAIVAGPADGRAQASLELGLMLDEIRDLFNRDIESHGKVQGLPSNFLMGELRARGDALAWSAQRNRFLSNLGYYREAMRPPHAGGTAAEAAFRLIQGWFWDSFTEDPLRPSGQSAEQLAAQIRIAEEYLRTFPIHAGREEASFILAVHYMQAALAADTGRRAGYAKKARRMSESYRADHPDSLRMATLTALLERLPP